MHDLDRTQPEMSWEAEGFEAGEFGYEGEAEVYGETLMEGLLSEAEEMELAAELLEITHEGELDQFFGKIFRKVGRLAGKVIKSPVGQSLGGILKGVAKKALPMAGGALGSIIAPGVGTALGSSVGSAAGQMFGLELEGMSAEDQEFEIARRFVRLISDAAHEAAIAPPTAPPQAVAQQAAVAAAQKHAPGLLSSPSAPAGSGAGQRGMRSSGRWIRRGRTIVLLGV